LVFNQAIKPPQHGHPSVGRHHEYWRRSQTPLEKKTGEFYVTVGHVGWRTGLYSVKSAGRDGAGHPADVGRTLV